MARFLRHSRRPFRVESVRWRTGIASVAGTTRRLVGARRRLGPRLRAQPDTGAAIALRLGGLLDARDLISELRLLVARCYGYEEVEVFSGSASEGCLRRQPGP